MSLTTKYDVKIIDNASGPLKQISAQAQVAVEAVKKLTALVDRFSTSISAFGVTLSMARREMLLMSSEMSQVILLVKELAQNIGSVNGCIAATNIEQFKNLGSAVNEVKENSTGVRDMVQPWLNLESTLTNIVSGFGNLISMSQKTGGAAKFSWIGIITIAIGGLIAVIDTLTASSEKQTKARQAQAEAAERARQVEETAALAYGKTQVSLQLSIEKLKNFNGTRQQEKLLVDEMNSKYGSAMGRFATVSQWYAALTKNADAYCQRLVNEARLTQLAAQAADIMAKRRTITHNADGTAKKYSTKRQEVPTYVSMYSPSAGYMMVKSGMEEVVGSSDVEKARASVELLDKELASIKSQMSDIQKGMVNFEMPVVGNTTLPEITSGYKDLGGSVWNLHTLEQYDARLQTLHNAQQVAGSARYAELQKEIELVEQMRKLFMEMGDAFKSNVSITDALGVKGFSVERPKNLKLLRIEPLEAQSFARGQQFKELAEHKQLLDDLRSKLLSGAQAFAEYRKGWGHIKGAVGSVTSLTDALTGQGSAWDKLVAVVDTALSLYDAITGIMSVVKTLTDASTAAQAIGIGVKKADTQASMENTTANVAEGASGVIAAHSKIPFVGIAIAGGMIAAMLALMASLPKFARGGIAYGPTLGLFGEYAGAANNPEVVAPLSRLRSLIGDAAPGMGGKVEFEIRGERLYGVLDRYKTRIARS